MTKPILTGDGVKEVRLRLGLTQEQLATKLGYYGVGRRQRVSKFETGLEPISYAHANLLLAMDTKGYEPVGYSDEEITLRQAEALWAARAEGKATALATTERGGGGGFRRMLKAMVEAGLLTAAFRLTPFGASELKHYEANHPTPLNPRTKGNPKGRWA